MRWSLGDLIKVRKGNEKILNRQERKQLDMIENDGVVYEDNQGRRSTAIFEGATQTNRYDEDGNRTHTFDDKTGKWKPVK